MKLLIIADDFTGALDTGVQFAQKGIATLVSYRLDINFDKVEKGTQVLVIDTESRHLSAEQAYNRVFSLASRARKHGIPYLYKKTDSTLRGNIGSELKAVQDAVQGEPVMFVPAYPQMGRTTVAGRQYVQGIPLQETAYARDHLNPIFSGSLSELIASQADVQVIVVKPGEIPADALNHHESIYIFDAEDEADLTAAGHLIGRLDKLANTAGCAGFADKLADLIAFEKTGPIEKSGAIDRAGTIKPVLSGRTLVICGSISGRSMLQLQLCADRGLRVVTLSPVQKSEAYWDSLAGKTFANQIRNQVQSEGIYAVRTASPREQPDLTADSRQVARSLGSLVRQVITGRSGISCNLVVIGGDTAIGIMEALQCSSLEPLQELAPGVALSKMHGQSGEMILISKAGGFGDDDLLQVILQQISLALG